MVKIDGIDKKILRMLMEDARRPILEIARNIGISGAAIHQRLRKLERSGLLEGSKFIINPKVLGYTTMAYVGIYLDKAMSNPLAVKELTKIPEVLECHYTTGDWSILDELVVYENKPGTERPLYDHLERSLHYTLDHPEPDDSQPASPTLVRRPSRP